MIIGTGIDIVEISRVKNACRKWKDKFLKRIFTEKEIEYSRQKPFSFQHLAARFAAKEAVLKAFGDGFSKRVEWTEIEVWNEKSGRPIVKLYGHLKQLKDDRGIKDIIISLSHARNYAVASAILIAEG
ncbi:MAG: holo-ACP synthase [Candidatus Omnitrophica bacterium]|nr:holo-ACP synthase [Candidatus Omnitrophota bacterium]